MYEDKNKYDIIKSKLFRQINVSNFRLCVSWLLMI